MIIKIKKQKKNNYNIKIKNIIKPIINKILPKIWIYLIIVLFDIFFLYLLIKLINILYQRKIPNIEPIINDNIDLKFGFIPIDNIIVEILDHIPNNPILIKFIENPNINDDFKLRGFSIFLFNLKFDNDIPNIIIITLNNNLLYFNIIFI